MRHGKIMKLIPSLCVHAGLLILISGCGGSGSKSLTGDPQGNPTTPTPTPIVSPNPTTSPSPTSTSAPTTTPLPTPVPGEIVSTPVDILWFGASTTAFSSASFPNYNLPYMIAKIYERLTGNEVPGSIYSNTAASTPLNSWLSRNSCSEDASNGMHQLHGTRYTVHGTRYTVHGTQAKYEAGCNSGADSSPEIFGDLAGDGKWNYIVASTFIGMRSDISEENGLLEVPPHIPEAVYRTLKEIRNYQQANGTTTKFMNLLLPSDDDELSNISTFGSIYNHLARVQCIKEVAASYGANMDSLATGTSFVNMFRAIDTGKNASERLAQRSFLTNEPLELGVPAPFPPIFNFDSRTSANTNIHFTRHGAALAAQTIAYQIYNINPLTVPMIDDFTPNGTACNGADDLCIISTSQYIFIQNIAKYSVDQYRAGNEWLSCGVNDR
ncbi:MAG: hypothetical protein ACI9Y1_000702 [Lentisphaeria bacterium]|jgi:hypothetical protein